MKINARWALPVYPILKYQSHWKMCEQILKKNTAPQYNSISLNGKKNWSAIIAGWEDEGGY